MESDYTVCEIPSPPSADSFNTAPVADIPNENYEPMLRAVYSTRLLYIVAIFFVKMSFLVLYLRLDHRERMRWLIYIWMFVVIGVSVSSFFVLAFSCFPPAVFWDITGTVEGHCMASDDQQSFYDANGILK
jgi:hypothetical protein